MVCMGEGEGEYGVYVCVCCKYSLITLLSYISNWSTSWIPTST